MSLLDPEAGGQPFISDDGQAVLIANGEVYNHRELAATLSGARMRTRSDCEVLLHLYQRDGSAFLDQVRGMCGVILWDKAKQQVILARDRFGIKPLYFHQNEQRVVAGSEIKALFEAPDTPRQVDWSASLADQLVSAEPHFTDAPTNTWFTGIESVPPGGMVIIDLLTGNRTLRQYAVPSVDEFTLSSNGSTDGLCDDFIDLLDAAVEETLMTDAGIGLFLSGGIDSALIAALAARHGALDCFTAVTASTLHNGDVEFAHRTATHLGLPYHPVVFPAGRFPTLPEWRSLLWLTETPMCGPEQWFKYELHRYCRTHRPEIKGRFQAIGSTGAS